MPDSSNLRHDCVWCGKQVEEMQLGITYDPETGKAYFEHRDKCPD
jgi:hypothetical protein